MPYKQDCAGLVEQERCIHGTEGGHNELAKTTLMDCNPLTNHLIPPLLCVKDNNNQVLDITYPRAHAIRTHTQFSESKTRNERRRSNKTPALVNEELSSARSWISETKYSKGSNIFMKHSLNGRNLFDVLSIAQPGVSLQCTNKPIKYLVENEYNCPIQINKDTCLRNTNLNIFKYLIHHSNNSIKLLPLPYIIGNLTTKNTIAASIKVSRKNDIFHQLKIDLGRSLILNGSFILSEWYGNITFNITRDTKHPNEPFPILPTQPEQQSTKFQRNSPMAESHNLLAPTFNESLSICQNVVVESRYLFHWRGDSIIGVNVELVLGSVPVTIPQKIVNKITKSKPRLNNKENNIISLIQKFNIRFYYAPISPGELKNETVSNSLTETYSNATELDSLQTIEEMLNSSFSNNSNFINVNSSANKVYEVPDYEVETNTGSANSGSEYSLNDNGTDNRQSESPSTIPDKTSNENEIFSNATAATPPNDVSTNTSLNNRTEKTERHNPSDFREENPRIFGYAFGVPLIVGYISR